MKLASLKGPGRDGTLAFMFETRYAYAPTAAASSSPALQRDYDHAWDGFARQGPA